MQRSGTDSRRLGAKALFNYTGDRNKGLLPKIAIEKIIEVISDLGEEFNRVPSVLQAIHASNDSLARKIHQLTLLPTA